MMMIGWISRLREISGEDRILLYGKHAKNLMKTDIREHDTGYELDIDLPGFKKDEIKAELENGYLTISATKGTGQRRAG